MNGFPSKNASPFFERRGQVLQVQDLKVAAHVHHHIALPVAQRLDLLAGAKMIILPVSFAGSGRARIIQHDGLQSCTQVGMEAAERLRERTLAHTRRPRQNDQPTGSCDVHRRGPTVARSGVGSIQPPLAVEDDPVRTKDPLVGMVIGAGETTAGAPACSWGGG